MNKKISIVIILGLIIFGSLYVYKNQTQINNQESTQDAIVILFSQKYNKPADDIVINLVQDDGAFAKGSINIKNEPGGGMWFAAKTANGWELAFDGNGMVTCATANEYDFPKDMIPQCLDTENGNQLIER